jgi:hypothetical protein
MQHMVFTRKDIAPTRQVIHIELALFTLLNFKANKTSPAQQLYRPAHKIHGSWT